MHDAKVIEEPEALRLPELQARYAEVVGEPTRSPNKKHLIRKIVDRMAVAELVEQRAAQAEGAGEVGTEPERDEATASTPPETTTPAAEAEVAPEEVDHGPETDAIPEPPATTDAPADPAPETEAPAAAPAKRARRKKAADETDGDALAADAEPKLGKLDIPALQAKFKELTGRESGSTNVRYLRWRVQQAMKGRIPVGPRAGRGGGEAVPHKVLPVRIAESSVPELDAAWARLGMRTRSEFFRTAVHAFLERVGEKEVAALFATAADAE